MVLIMANDFVLKINTVGRNASWEEAKGLAEMLGGQYYNRS
jgi:hypothetical protein